MINPEIEEVNSLVRKYLDIYDFRISPDHLEFYFTIEDMKVFENKFDELRVIMLRKNLIPFVKRKNAEYVLIVVKRQKRKYWGVYVNIILLILTILSTIWVGMGYYTGYYGATDLPDAILGGFLYFSLPLLTILGSHEMGHYFMARKHRIAASLPFFIPAPTILGTLGAFISLRDPIPDKKSLVDVGLAGPFVGFIVAIPVTIIGIILGNTIPPHVDFEAINKYYEYQMPLIYQFITLFIPSSGYIHPVAVAGWVGFVVTAINLIPMGQLDGGHAARALLGEKTKYMSYAMAAFLIGMGLLYPGWLIFGLLVILLGLRHPPPLNEVVKLDKKRIAVAITGFLLFTITFVPVPIQYVEIPEHVSMNVEIGSNILIENYTNYTDMYIKIVNSGKMRENITVNISGDFSMKKNEFVFSLDKGGNRSIEEKIWMIDKGTHIMKIHLKTKTGKSIWRNFTINCFVESSHFYFSPSLVHDYRFNTTLVNTGENRTLNIFSLNNVSFNITNLGGKSIEMEKNTMVNLEFVVMGSTTIVAVDYHTYECSLLKIETGI